MKLVKLGIAVFCLLSIISPAKSQDSQQPIEVIPAVESVSYDGAAYKLSKSISIGYPQELTNEATFLKGYLLKEHGIDGKLSPNTRKGDIVLAIGNPTATDNKEAYQLTVNKKGIRIEAPAAAGIFYGIQTLRQIIGEDNRTVNQLSISDAPAFRVRSFMLDEGRNFKGKAVVKQLMDEMARLKMNTFHWHLTDDQGWRIEIKKYPKLTEIGAFRDSTQIGGFNSTKYDPNPHGGFYTQDDIREIVAYATARHINIIPEIEIPGHASASIAAYPWLGTTGKQIKVSCRFGVHHEVYNVANPKVFDFLDDVIDEMIQLFPGEIFHIGGDEVRYNHWKESEETRKFMEEKGIQTYPELQVWITNLMSENLQGKIGYAKYTYNSGQMIQAGVLLYQATGDEQYLKDAQQTAKGSYEHFLKPQPTVKGEMKFFPSSPWFNVILFRGLKALYEVDKNDTYVKAMIDNADYAWQYTRDENGLLNNDWSGNRKDKFKSLLENSCMIELYSEISEL